MMTDEAPAEPPVVAASAADTAAAPLASERARSKWQAAAGKIIDISKDEKDVALKKVVVMASAQHQALTVAVLEKYLKKRDSAAVLGYFQKLTTRETNIPCAMELFAFLTSASFEHDSSNNFLLSCADTFGEIYRVYLEDKKEDARPADWQIIAFHRALLIFVHNVFEWHTDLLKSICPLLLKFTTAVYGECDWESDKKSYFKSPSLNRTFFEMTAYIVQLLFVKQSVRNSSADREAYADKMSSHITTLHLNLSKWAASNYIFQGWVAHILAAPLLEERSKVRDKAIDILLRSLKEIPLSIQDSPSLVLALIRNFDGDTSLFSKAADFVRMLHTGKQILPHEYPHIVAFLLRSLALVADSSAKKPAIISSQIDMCRLLAVFDDQYITAGCDLFIGKESLQLIVRLMYVLFVEEPTKADARKGRAPGKPEEAANISFVLTTFERSLDSILDLAVSSPRPMTEDQTAMRKILHAIAKRSPKRLGTTLLSISKCSGGNTRGRVANAARLAFLCEFFRFDELFFPESVRDAAPALTEFANKPVLFIHLVEGSTTGVSTILLELIVQMQRWKHALEVKAKEKSDVAQLVRQIRENVSTMEYWLLVHLQSVVSQGLDIGVVPADADQPNAAGNALFLQMLYVQFFQEARAFVPVSKKVKGWVSILCRCGQAEAPAAALAQLAAVMDETLKLYKSTLTPTFMSRPPSLSVHPDSAFMLSFRVREEALVDLASSLPCQQAYRSLLYVVQGAPSLLGAVKTSNLLEQLWKKLDEKPYGSEYRTICMVFQGLADVKELEPAARKLVLSDLYDKSPAVRTKAVIKVGHFFDLRVHFGVDDKFFKIPVMLISFPSIPIGRDDYNVDEPEWYRHIKLSAEVQSMAFSQKRATESQKRTVEREREQRKALSATRTPAHAFATGEASSSLSSFYSNILPLAAQVLIDLLDDTNPAVVLQVRPLLRRIIVEEPNIVLRPFLGDFSHCVQALLSATRAPGANAPTITPAAKEAAAEAVQVNFLRLQPSHARLIRLATLEPRVSSMFAHTLFSYLLGGIKTVADDAPVAVPYVQNIFTPLFTFCLSAIKDLRLRDVRRSRTENLLVTNGSFWYSHQESQKESQKAFPRGPNDVPKSVGPLLPASYRGWSPLKMLTFNMHNMRVHQVLFMIAFAKYCPSELTLLKTSLLPMTENLKNMDDWGLTNGEAGSTLSASIALLSHEHKRLWLRFLETVCRQFNEDNNFLDHKELVDLIDTVNAVVTRYMSDADIVRQAFVFYISVAVYFFLWCDRLGYLSFMATFVRVFHNAVTNRLDDIVDGARYTYARFVALHQDRFVLQNIEANHAQLVGPNADSALASSFFQLIMTVQEREVDSDAAARGVVIGGVTPTTPRHVTPRLSVDVAALVGELHGGGDLMGRRGTAVAGARRHTVVLPKQGGTLGGPGAADMTPPTTAHENGITMKSISQMKDTLGVFLDAPPVRVAKKGKYEQEHKWFQRSEDEQAVNEFGVAFYMKTFLTMIALNPNTPRSLTLMKMWRTLMPYMLPFLKERTEDTVLRDAVRLLIMRIVKRIVSSKASAAGREVTRITRFLRSSDHSAALLKEIVLFVQFYVKSGGTLKEPEAVVMGRVLSNTIRDNPSLIDSGLEWFAEFIDTTFENATVDPRSPLARKAVLSDQLSRLIRSNLKWATDAPSMLRGFTAFLRANPLEAVNAEIANHFLEFALAVALESPPVNKAKKVDISATSLPSQANLGVDPASLLAEAVDAADETAAPAAPAAQLPNADIIDFLQALIENTSEDIIVRILAGTASGQNVALYILYPLAHQLSRTRETNGDYVEDAWVRIISYLAENVAKTSALPAASRNARSIVANAANVNALLLALLRPPSGFLHPDATHNATSAFRVILAQFSKRPAAAEPDAPADLDELTRFRVLDYLSTVRGQLSQLLRPHVALILPTIVATTEEQKRIVEAAERTVATGSVSAKNAEFLKRLEADHGRIMVASDRK